MIAVLVLVLIFCGLWDLYDATGNRSRREKATLLFKGVCYLVLALTLFVMDVKSK